MESKSTKTKILDRAADLFFQFGFSKVSMDELASELSMSKKTIYKYFPGKKVLIWAIVNSIKSDIKYHIEKIVADQTLGDEIQLKKAMNFIAMKLSKIQKPLLIDVQRNYPEIWEDINQFRKKMLSENVRKILDNGIKAGTFRKDIDVDIFMMMYMNTVQTVITPKTLAEVSYTASEVFEMMVKVFFGGILTEYGRQNYFLED